MARPSAVGSMVARKRPPCASSWLNLRSAARPSSPPVGVDEHEIERRLCFDLAQRLERGPDVDVRPRRHARLAERLGRHPRMLLGVLERVQHAVRSHAAQEADTAVAAQGPDLDRLQRAHGMGDDLQVQTVEPAHRDCGEPLADAALADLAQHGVLRAENLFRPPRERGIALPEALVLR